MADQMATELRLDKADIEQNQWQDRAMKLSVNADNLHDYPK
jgi:hypothetical protein